MKQIVYSDYGAIDEIHHLISEHSYKRIFLVSDKKLYELCGAKSALQSRSKETSIFHFSDFLPNPQEKNVVSGVAAFNDFKADVVVSIGGGSAIDMAKLIRFFGDNTFSIDDYMQSNAIDVQKLTPLLVIPTTAGSGSEATQFAVLYRGRQKYSITHEKILPEMVLIDPELAMSLPAHITASSGMDALCQAIESYWSVFSTNESKEYSRKAIQLILPNLSDAVNSPNRQSRKAMATAAHLAGKAINISKTTAPHAVSYPITSYFGVQHGHAAALTLPSFLEYNSQVTEDDFLDERGVSYVQQCMMEIVHMLQTEDIPSAKLKLESLMDDIFLERRLSKLGIESKEDVDIIVENGFNPQRVKNNPRKLTEFGLRDILNKIL